MFSYLCTQATSMPAFMIPSAILPALQFALNFIPDGVPSRFEKVAAYVKTYCDDHPNVKLTPKVQVRYHRHETAFYL